MPLLKYWFENTSQNARPLETPINPKRVTAAAPSSSVKTFTSEEKQNQKASYRTTEIAEENKSCERENW